VRILKGKGSYNGPIASEEVGRFPDIGFSYIFVAPISGADDTYGGVMAFSDKPITADMSSLKLAGRLIGDAMQKY
jgi:hypothetical protein